LNGDEGNDVLFVSFLPGDNTLDGGEGNDSLSALHVLGNNTLNGGIGDDEISLSLSFFLYGYEATEPTTQKVDGGDGKDLFKLDLSDDTNGVINFLRNSPRRIEIGIHAIEFENIEAFDFTYGSGRDRISVDSDYDSIINSGAGRDVLEAYGLGNHTLNGGDDDDYLLVGSHIYGNNTLNGGDGDDTLSIRLYADGNNTLNGGDGNDELDASKGDGNNILNGGNGDDILIGGGTLHSTTFVYDSLTPGYDLIRYFSTSQDKIQISADSFGAGLSAGLLDANAFVIASPLASEVTSEHRFIFDDDNNVLYFTDGSGDIDSLVLLATFEDIFTNSLVSMSHENFVIV
jgi:Ca2+-binding RTX toxin-like protein